MSVLYIVAKLFVSLIGLLALRLMLFMYEPEEERWQDATIEAWMFAEDRAIKSGREWLDYLAKVANVTSRILNRVFGDLFLCRVGLVLSDTRVSDQDARKDRSRCAISFLH